MTFQDFQKQNAFRAKLLYYFLSNPEIALEIEASILEERNLSPEVYTQLKSFNNEVPELSAIQPKELSPRLTEYFTVAAKWLIELFDDSLGAEYRHEAYKALAKIASYDNTASLVVDEFFNEDSLKDKNLGFNKVKATHWLDINGSFIVEIKSNKFKLIITLDEYQKLIPIEIRNMFNDRNSDPRDLLAANCYAEHLLKNYVHSQYRQHVKQIIDAKAATQSSSN